MRALQAEQESATAIDLILKKNSNPKIQLIIPIKLIKAN